MAINDASTKLCKARSRGSGNLWVFEQALSKARAKRDGAIAKFIEDDGAKTREAIEAAENNIKDHVTDELKSLKEDVAALKHAIGVSPELATTSQLVAQRHLLANHLKIRREQDKNEAEEAKLFKELFDENTQRPRKTMGEKKQGEKENGGEKKQGKKEKAGKKKEKTEQKDTTQANIDKLFGVKAAADENMDVETPGGSSSSKEAPKRKAQNPQAEEGPKRRKIDKKEDDSTAAPVPDMFNDGLLTDKCRQKVTDAQPRDKPRLFRNVYVLAFEKNNKQPIQKFENAWLKTFDKYHNSGIAWAKKDGVIFEELDNPAPVAEAPAQAPKQKAPKEKAPKQKAKAVEKKAEQPPSPTTV